MRLYWCVHQVQHAVARNEPRTRGDCHALTSQEGRAEMYVDSESQPLFRKTPISNTRGTREVIMEQRQLVTCSYCDREMGMQECLYDHVVINGEEYKRVRVVESPFYEGEPQCECGCEIGEVHHPGCDLEDCPRCGWQFLMCLMDGGNCNVEGFYYQELSTL